MKYSELFQLVFAEIERLGFKPEIMKSLEENLSRGDITTLGLSKVNTKTSACSNF